MTTPGSYRRKKGLWIFPPVVRLVHYRKFQKVAVIAIAILATAISPASLANAKGGHGPGGGGGTHTPAPRSNPPLSVATAGPALHQVREPAHTTVERPNRARAPRGCNGFDFRTQKSRQNWPTCP